MAVGLRSVLLCLSISVSWVSVQASVRDVSASLDGAVVSAGRETADVHTQATYESGFLFINGQWFDAPVEIAFGEREFRVHSDTFRYDQFDLSDQIAARDDSRHRGSTDRRSDVPRGGRFDRRQGGFPQGGRGWRRDRDAPETKDRDLELLLRQACQRLFEQLPNGTVMVLQDGRPPYVTTLGQEGYELLSMLAGSGSAEMLDGLLPREADAWQSLVAGFRPTGRFVERVNESLQEIKSALERNEQRAWMVDFGQWVSYPMTMLALVLVVMAFGQLIQAAQPMFADDVDGVLIGRAKLAAGRMLLILILMSVIDLVWTLVAHGSGTMRELNPLGSKLISDPGSLVAFKVLMTGMAVLVLYSLRDRAIARKATWWCCLTLTLLTARWLTFHSMLV